MCNNIFEKQKKKGEYVVFNLLDISYKKKMLQDFSIKRNVQDIKRRDEIEHETRKLMGELRKLRGLQMGNNNNRQKYEEEKSKALVVKQKTSIFSRIASLFHRGEYYNATQQIKIREEQMKKLEEEGKELDEKTKQLESTIKEKNTELVQLPQSRCMRENNGELVITDGNVGIVGYKVAKNQTEVGPERRVLVHCTNFFPKNNVILSDYDGEKIGYPVRMHYHGVEKEVRGLVHRHEVHCCVNARVESTGDGAGNWASPSYIVIDRYDAHQNELESLGASDTWTKGTSIKLTKDAVIMVKLQDKEKLPIDKNDRDKYNIVYYEGNPTTCLQNFLRLNDYEIFETDARNPAHAHSIRKIAENYLNDRDLAINFVKDNTFFSKESPVFSAEELAPIVDVAITNSLGGTAISLLDYKQEDILLSDKKISKKEEKDYIEVAKFVIGSGLKKTDDGRYTFASDDEVLDTIEEICKDTTKLPSSVDVGLIDEVFTRQQQYAQEFAKLPRPSYEEIKSMQLGEIYKFKNQLACETLQTVCHDLEKIVGANDHVTLIKHGDNGTDIESKVRKEDGVKATEWSKRPGDYLIEMNIDSKEPAESVEKGFRFLKEKDEEIQSRSVVRQDMGEER